MFHERHSAQPERLNVYGAIAMIRVHSEDLAVHPREQFEDRDLLTVFVLKTEDAFPSGQNLLIDLHADGTDFRDICAVDAVKCIKTQRSHL